MKRNPVIPSLFAPDLDATIDYYVGTLGFTETANWDEDGKRVWAEVSYGDAIIWFFAHPLPGQTKPVTNGMIYVFVDDVDAVAAALDGKVPARWGPEDQDYGLRELGIEDLNGYLIVFAKDV